MLSQNDIYAQLTDVFRDVFIDDDIVLRPEMTADDIEHWDSVSHVNLLVAIESRFGLRITSAEIERLKCVDDLARLIAAKSG